MSQLTSMETAEHQKQHGTFHVQMPGVRVLWVSPAHGASTPILKPCHCSHLQATPYDPFHSCQAQWSLLGETLRALLGVISQVTSLNAVVINVPSILQKIIRKIFPLLHINARIKHKLTFISKPHFFFLLLKWLDVYLLQNSNSETQFIRVCELLGSAGWEELQKRAECLLH